MSLYPSGSLRQWAMAARRVVVWLVVAGTCGTMVGQQPQPLPRPVTPDQLPNRQGRQVSLKNQLRVGLKAVTKEDFAFIDAVVAKVDQGKLPRSMVDGTFLWARNRYKTRMGAHRLRPMVYFQPALVLQARAVGVHL